MALIFKGLLCKGLIFKGVLRKGVLFMGLSLVSSCISLGSHRPCGLSLRHRVWEPVDVSHERTWVGR